MDYDTQALQLAQNLGIGQTTRTSCPACHGGDKQETTWVVGREPDRVWYKCFRATCPGATGIVGSHTLAPAIQQERARALERINPYTKPAYALLDSDWDYFQQRFEIERTPYSWIQVTADDEYLLAVLGPRGEIRGRVVRQPVWKGNPRAPREGRRGYWDNSADPSAEPIWKPMPKTVLYPQTTAPMVSWYYGLSRQQARRHLVIVEDQISAIKVAQHTSAAALALLGTGMNVEIVRDIVRQTPDVVTIALDPGAEGQAQNLAKKWGLYFEKTRVVMLEADPKDIPARDLAEELGT